MSSPMPISVDMQHMHDLEQTLVNTSIAIEQHLADLRSQLQNLQWDGGDREAYNEAQRNWDKAVDDLRQLLSHIGGHVGVARDGYAEAELSNIKSFQQH